MQQKRWLEVMGALLLIVAGLLFLFDNLKLLPDIEGIIWAALLAAGGVSFLVAYLLDRRQWWPLIPGFALTGVGATILLNDILPAYKEMSGAVIFASLAVAFAGVYLAQPRANWWAVIPGGVMVALTLVVLLSSAYDELGGAVFFLVLGAIFVAVYLAEIDGQRYHWWALIPAGALFSLAVVVVLSMLDQGTLAGAALFFGLGLTFGLLYLIRGENRPLGWAWIPAVALIGFGILILTVTGDSILAQLFLPLALIVSGVVFLIRTWRSRAQRLE